MPAAKKKTEPLAVQWVDPAKLSLDQANARKHSDKNLDAIRSSLLRFGWQQPLIVDSKMVVRAGNGRLMVARQEEMDSVPIVVSDLPLTELAAFAIADNRTAELAEWDLEALDASLNALAEEGFNLDDLGFDAADLDLMLVDLMADADTGGDGEGDEDNSPEVNLFSCPVSVDQEIVIRKAIAEAKRATDVTTTGDALQVLAEAYLAKN